MSLYEEAIVLSTGRLPDISPPFIPADINTGELESCPSLSFLNLLHIKEGKENKMLLFGLKCFPYN